MIFADRKLVDADRLRTRRASSVGLSLRTSSGGGFEGRYQVDGLGPEEIWKESFAAIKGGRLLALIVSLSRMLVGCF